MYRKDNKGFTIAELLVVVAIIGILIAVSIPIFSSQAEKAREATDKANERSAKSAASALYLTDEKYGTYYYDAASGLLTTNPSGISAYGKGTSAGSVTEDHTGKIIQCIIKEDGTIEINWTKGGIVDVVFDNEDSPLSYLNSLRSAANINSFTQIDSTSTNGKNVKTISGELSSQFKSTNINTWKIYKSNNNFTIWVSDVDITKVPKGTNVRVISYDVSSKKYTAEYVTVGSVTNKLPSGSQTYNYLLKDSTPSVIAPATDNYQKALLTFNSASQIKQ